MSKDMQKTKIQRIYLLWFILLALFFVQVPGALQARADDNPEQEKVTYRVSGEIYQGKRNSFNTPCVLDRDKVFAKIPAYKKIKREGLDKNSARYYFLLEEANRVFRAAVKKVAEEKGYDLVVEKGGIKASKDVQIPDITSEVIKAV
jgi:hypothetical protein